MIADLDYFVSIFSHHKKVWGASTLVQTFLCACKL